MRKRHARSSSILGALALPPALALSAAVMAASAARPGYAGLAWICLLPLLAAARSLRPLHAALAGAGWGLCFYAASVHAAAATIEPGPAAGMLLAIVPACYVMLGSLATRALGFVPAILALLWILAELALQPLGLDGGLLAGTQGQDQLSSWLAGLLGYVLVASAIVYANALVLDFLERVRWPISIEQGAKLLPPHASAWVHQRLSFSLVSSPVQAQPRAPPASPFPHR